MTAGAMALSQPPRGLLLDMDGTLLDTEWLWFHAEQAAVARFGGALPLAANEALVGLDTDTLVARLISDYGARTDAATLRAAIEAELPTALAQAQAYPGAAELVGAAVAHGVRCAVVSNSPRDIVRDSLAPHAWAAKLTLRVSADDVARPKPHPDAYQLALERLGLEPAACVAIEDSPTGARAAIAAGITCLAVAHDAGQATALQALTPHVVTSLSAARRWLGLPDEPTPGRLPSHTRGCVG